MQTVDTVSFLACDHLVYMSVGFHLKDETSEGHLREDVANKVCMFRQQLLHVFTCTYSVCVCVCVCVRESVCSVCSARGSSRLVQPHGFTKPASKVHLLRLRPLDKCMILKQNKHNHVQIRQETLKNLNNLNGQNHFLLSRPVNSIIIPFLYISYVYIS